MVQKGIICAGQGWEAGDSLILTLRNTKGESKEETTECSNNTGVHEFDGICMLCKARTFLAKLSSAFNRKVRGLPLEDATIY